MSDAYLEKLRQAWEEDKDRRLREEAPKTRADKGGTHVKRKKKLPGAMDKNAPDQAAKKIDELAKETVAAKEANEVLDSAASAASGFGADQT